MNTRRPPLTALVALCVALAAALLTCAPAQAAFSRHPFLGSFGPEGPISLTSFSDVQGVAVDAAGDVYVYDTHAAGGSIYKFNAAGEAVDFSALGTNVITGVGGAARDENELAVDDSAGGPAKGDIYVANGSDIGIYGPDGVPLEVGGRPAELNGEVQTEVPGAPWGEPCGVAVDASGNVYVGLANSENHSHVNRYSPSSGAVVNTDYESSLWGLDGEVCNIAVDPAGDVYADTYERGPVMRYEPSQFETKAQFEAEGETPASGTEVDAAGSTLAADPDPSRHLLYVDEQGDIAEYESSGELRRLSAFGTSEPGMLSPGESFGVSASAAGEVYAPNGSGLVNIYGATHPQPPLVEEESTTEVTASAATLHAQIDPALYDTHYYFQWGSADCAADPAACIDVSTPPGIDIGAGEDDVSSSTELRDLTPGTVYHYRVIARNTNGTTEGPDQTFTTQPAVAASGLLDERAYEMVSPLEKNGSLILGIDGFPSGGLGGLSQAAANGESMVYTSSGAFADPAGATLEAQYLATRRAGAWSTVNINPPGASFSYDTVGGGGPYKAFSAELSSGLLLNAAKTPVESPPLTNDAPAGYQNYYVQELGAGPGDFQAVLTSPPSQSSSSFALEMQGATPDLRHIVFATGAALTTNAVQGGGFDEDNLYEWSGGELHLVNILPGAAKGTPHAVLGYDDNGDSAGGLYAISDGGLTVFFTDEENLYARMHAEQPQSAFGPGGECTEAEKACTVEVDSSQGPEGGHGLFQTASSDGSRVFFTDNSKLTSDSTAARASENIDLYEYDLGSGRLSDLTTQDPSGAKVQGVLGASEDGSYVYFVARGILSSGENGEKQKAVAGGDNLYVWHRGTSADTVGFIATLSEDDNVEGGHDENQKGAAGDWATRTTERTSRVAADGQNLVFMSDRDLTGYDNQPAEPADCGVSEEGSPFLSGPCQEVYDYNAGAGVLGCASCDPTGARPVGPSNIPGGTQSGIAHAIYQSRVLSSVEGRARVFFDSEDALAPQDTDGTQDVYEWEEDGRGSCRIAGGCVGPISSGTSGEESSFLDASADGDDVFFLTKAKLVAGDTDNLIDVYDARAPHVPGEAVGAAPAVLVSPPCNNGDSCKPPASAQPAIFGAPASATFTGPGNPQSSAHPASRPASKPQSKPSKCKRNSVKKHHKCVKAKTKKKHAKKTARANRRAQS